jgi:hypothetical protein
VDLVEKKLSSSGSGSGGGLEGTSALENALMNKYIAHQVLAAVYLYLSKDKLSVQVQLLSKQEV